MLLHVLFVCAIVAMCFCVCTQFDIKWKESYIPIVYDDKATTTIATSMLLDKPAQIYSKIKGQCNYKYSILHLEQCNTI